MVSCSVSEGSEYIKSKLVVVQVCYQPGADPGFSRGRGGEFSKNLSTFI